MTDQRKGEAPLIATASQTVGPFFHFGLTRDGMRYAGEPDPDAPRMQLSIRVTDGLGEPIDDAMVELWIPGDGPDAPAAFARLPTRGDGWCNFETVRPGPSADGERSAAHVNVCVFARGLLRHLHTRIYFTGDPALADDAVLALVPEDRRRTLLATPDGAVANRWTFDLRLQGTNETVFFDV